MSLSPRKPALQYVALAAITVIIGGGAGVIWAQLTDGERASLFSILNERASLILTSAFLFILAAVVVTQWIIRRYIEPLRKLVEDVKLMNVANSTRRLAAQGTSELRELASAINQSADVIQSLKVDVDRRVQESQKDIEREKHILSTLVDEFASGVVVCNMEGVILLHNKKARELLERADPEGNSLTSAGLGRSNSWRCRQKPHFPRARPDRPAIERPESQRESPLCDDRLWQEDPACRNGAAADV